MSGFNDPVAGGGGQLVLPAIHSPGYTPGSTGWSINKNGTVEFNSGTFRGTVTGGSFVGTDYIQNAAGTFFYSATPATGNLIASIAPAAGVDAFGNSYVAGFGVYNNTLQLFAQVSGAGMQLGTISAGVPDTTDAGFIASSINGVTQTIGMGSPVNVSLIDPALWVLRSGQAGKTTGQTGAPYAQLYDSTSVSEVDALISGSLRKTDVSGNALTLQTPAYGSNWSDSTTFNGSANWAPLRWRVDVENNLHIGGAFKAGSTLPGAAVMNIPAPYRPAGQYAIDCARNNAGTVTTGFMLALTTGGNLDIISQTGGGIATGNEYLVTPTKIPLGALP